MSRPTDVVRRWYEAIVSTGDESAIAEVIAPEYEEVHDGVRYALGLAGAVGHVRGVRRTWPDLTLNIERQVAEGEWVASLVTMRGTHLGAWAGLPVTGAAMRVTAVNVDRVVDGRIVEHGGAANLLGPLLAAGAVRPGEEGAAARRLGPAPHHPLRLAADRLPPAMDDVDEWAGHVATHWHALDRHAAE